MLCSISGVLHQCLQTDKHTERHAAVVYYYTEIDTFLNDCSDFETFYNPIHGNCYVFNAGWNTSKPLLWSKSSGVRHGQYY